ncbi:hypothetical protein [Azospirillum sp. B4]|uniref:hypothetical protein n=1 Tax=Azospirillum sp. B4 TaxID=95605 RepID=UPI0003472000|nr:hypothetical protein [Azospirillum sp. B4]
MQTDRSRSIVTRLLLAGMVLAGLSGCVVEERPYHRHYYHDGYGYRDVPPPPPPHYWHND